MAWIETSRREYRRNDGKYETDLSYTDWQLIARFLPEPGRLVRPRSTDLRKVVEEIFYMLGSSCQWRMLPKDFPPYSTVQRFFYRWREEGLWQRVQHALVMAARVAKGREASPTAGVIDSQSVKTTEAGGPRGYDAGKKVKGRKRQLLTDTIGLPIASRVHEARIQDRDGTPLGRVPGRGVACNSSPSWLSSHGLMVTVSGGLAEDGAAGRNAGHDQSVVASFS